jgi:hypothetical protein
VGSQYPTTAKKELEGAGKGKARNASAWPAFYDRTVPRLYPSKTYVVIMIVVYVLCTSSPAADSEATSPSHCYIHPIPCLQQDCRMLSRLGKPWALFKNLGEKTLGSKWLRFASETPWNDQFFLWIRTGRDPGQFNRPREL